VKKIPSKAVRKNNNKQSVKNNKNKKIYNKFKKEKAAVKGVCIEKKGLTAGEESK
jgi:hypothetical protein